MDDTRREAWRDFWAVLSMLIFVLGVGLGLFLFFFYTVLPRLVGPLDQPIENMWLVIPFLLAFAVIFSVGGFCGGIFWLVAMSRFLPKQTMYKWLTYGPQIDRLLKLNLRLLDTLYKK